MQDHIANKYWLTDGNLATENKILTRKVEDEVGKTYYAKIIKGLDSRSQAVQIFSDKLNHLRRAQVPTLPEIADFGFDQEQGFFYILFEEIQEASPLNMIDPDRIDGLTMIRSFITLAEGLEELLQKHRIIHNDIHPGNILFSRESRPFLIDFGLADLAQALSESAQANVFAAAFAAPERKEGKQRRMPFKSDLYSLSLCLLYGLLGPVEYDAYQDIESRIDALSGSENIPIQLQPKLIKSFGKCLEPEPENRVPRYRDFIQELREIQNGWEKSGANPVGVYFKDHYMQEINAAFFDELIGGEAAFDINPRSGVEINLSVATESFLARPCFIEKDILKVVRVTERGASDTEKQWKRVKKYGKRLVIKDFFEVQSPYHQPGLFRLEPLFREWLQEKQQAASFRGMMKNQRNELEFYKGLLNKELQVLFEKSLRLRYARLERPNPYEIELHIIPHEKYSGVSQIFSHIDQSLDRRSDGFEYVLSPKGDMKQVKEPVRMAAQAWDYDTEENILYFRDVEIFGDEKAIPVRDGFLFEDISSMEEEKKRQQDAIRAAEHREAANPALIHYLFNPHRLNDLERPYIEPVISQVFQANDEGELLEYSVNQARAINNALHRKPISVIQGPPGTGKTTVITEIIFQLLDRNPQTKILVTAQTNDAVDHVLDNLLKQDIKVVRLAGRRKPRNEVVRKNVLESKLEAWKDNVRKRCSANFKKQAEQEFDSILASLNPILRQIVKKLISNQDWKYRKRDLEKTTGYSKDYRKLGDSLKDEDSFREALSKLPELKGLDRFFRLKRLKDKWLNLVAALDKNSEINQKLINSIRVIGATCNHIASKKYRKFDFAFDYVIMDESGKATTAEALVPIVMGENLVLVGDHRQLRPMITATREVKAWLKEQYKDTEEYLIEGEKAYLNRPSLFEQIVEEEIPDFKSQLTECRRSSKQQVIMTSRHFYEAFSDQAIIPVDRPQEKEHNLPVAHDTSLAFFDIGSSGRHNKNPDTGSSYNRTSAKLILELLRRLAVYPQVKKYSIGVITGYSSQAAKIRKQIRNARKKGQLKLQNINLSGDQLAISVVDRFQGLEKDIIIFDCVRSGLGITLGFLSAANRINVALSRQKKMLLIVGDYQGLLKAKNLDAPGQPAALQNYLEDIEEKYIFTDPDQFFYQP